MNRRQFLALAAPAAGAQIDPGYKPVRTNKVIELLAGNQPVYYTESRGGGYEEGRKYAKTWADYIDYELENGDFNLAALRGFMQGLVDAGPTPSGHRTPAVIATLPVGAMSEAVMRANYWVVQQVLAAGVHGIILPHARSPEAVRAFVEATRYPFAKPLVAGLGEGLKGMGSQLFASKIWGISPEEYLYKADPWPLNPEGELILGLKIEDRHALQNAEFTTRVPGVAYAEWGSSDMSFSLGTPGKKDTPEMRAARNRVQAACKAAGIFFLEGSREDTVIGKIQEGIRLGGSNEKAADTGRRFTKRRMPW
jgi:4-hydroxy-2-oxoheptanedioate aldolase